MNEYLQVRRLQSEEYIGSGHIAVERHSAGTYPLHWHDYFEMEIVLSGRGTQIYNGRTYTLMPGSAYILTPVDFHSLETEPGVELLNISFDDVCLPESMLAFLSDHESTRICQFSREETARFLMAAQLLEHACACDGPCKQQLLEYLVSCFAFRDPQPQQVRSAHLSGIRKAISYIELHFRENISLGQLAELSGYTPTYFSELFRRVTGETYIQRLKSLRISYARMLLANGLSVTDACFASGFGSLSNFLTAFKEKIHMTPSEYRKNAQSPD